VAHRRQLNRGPVFATPLSRRRRVLTVQVREKTGGVELARAEGVRRLLVTFALLAAVSGCASPDDPPPPLADGCPAADEVARDRGCAVQVGLVCPSAGYVCGDGWGAASFLACRCQDGAWVCDDPGAYDGAACALSVGASCEREGPQGCSESGQPGGAACTCAEGIWTCSESCYMACPSVYADGLAGRACQGLAEACTYPDGHVCECEEGALRCT
jgi:hypothetical protein